MKKILLTFFIFIAYTGYAFGECSIESQTPEEIKNYVQNISIIANNLNKKGGEIAKQKYANLSDIEAMKKMQLLGNEVTRGLNTSSNGWEEYEFDFKNLIEELKETERPIPINRDLKMIDSNIEKFSKYISTSIKQLYSREELKKDDICKGFKGDCNIGDYKIASLLIDIKTDLSKIKIAILNGGKIQGSLLFDNENKIKTSIEQNYKKENIEECKMSKSGFGGQMNEAISEISLNNKSSEKGMQKWKDAWAMLIGVKVDSEAEKKLLSNELRRQGVSENGIKNMLSNLDNYNSNGGYSSRDNFFSNTYSSIVSSVKRQINSFNESLEKYFVDKNVGGINVQKFLETKNKTTKVEEIREKINTLYSQNKSIIQEGDLNTNNIMTRLAKMHTYIASSITTLQKTIPISEKVCNDQCSGKGICTY